mmetsp:Transcript_24101/g.66802  ORF Transcript_24101/g.66802 Transcript_24101/m.66802 type:complete len:259 (+) Transcript_24101:615-1391(+)
MVWSDVAKDVDADVADIADVADADVADVVGVVDVADALVRPCWSSTTHPPARYPVIPRWDRLSVAACASRRDSVMATTEIPMAIAQKTSGRKGLSPTEKGALPSPCKYSSLSDRRGDVMPAKKITLASSSLPDLFGHCPVVRQARSVRGRIATRKRFSASRIRATLPMSLRRCSPTMDWYCSSQGRSDPCSPLPAEAPPLVLPPPFWKLPPREPLPPPLAESDALVSFPAPFPATRSGIGKRTRPYNNKLPQVPTRVR